MRELRHCVEKTVDSNGQDRCCDVNVTIRVKNLQSINKVIREGNPDIAADLAPIRWEGRGAAPQWSGTDHGPVRTSKTQNLLLQPRLTGLLLLIDGADLLRP